MDAASISPRCQHIFHGVFFTRVVAAAAAAVSDCRQTNRQTDGCCRRVKPPLLGRGLKHVDKPKLPQGIMAWSLFALWFGDCIVFGRPIT